MIGYLFFIVRGGESDPDSGQILPTLGVLRGTFGSN